MWALMLIPVLASQPGVGAEEIGGPPGEGAQIMGKILLQHLKAGDRYLDQKKFDEAIAEYQKALQVAPNELHAHMNLGIAYQGKQMWDQAIVEYEKSIGLAPDLVAAHNNLGLAYWKKGRHQEAITELKRTISLAPDKADGHANLGTAYVSAGMLKEAIAEYEKALEIAPGMEIARKNLAITHGNLGVNQYNAGRYGEAIPELKKALELDPEFSEARALIEIIEKEGKPEAVPEPIGPPGLVAEESYQVAGELKPWEEEITWGKDRSVQRPFVEVLVNGRQKERFLIDTRIPYMAIAQDLFNALQGGPGAGIKAEESKKYPLPKGGRAREAYRERREYRVSLDSLKVGGLILKNVPALAMMALPERGILSLPGMGRLGMIRLDLQVGKLGFKPYDELPKEGGSSKTEAGSGEMLLPFSNPGGAIIVDISMNDKPCKALIDIGSSSTLISPDFLRGIGLRTKVSPQSYKDLQAISEGSLRGVPAWRIVQGKVKVRIGTEEISGNRYGEILSHEFQPSEVDVILGMPHLKGFILTIDYRNQQIRFERSRK